MRAPAESPEVLVTQQIDYEVAQYDEYIDRVVAPGLRHSGRTDCQVFEPLSAGPGRRQLAASGNQALCYDEVANPVGAPRMRGARQSSCRDPTEPTHSSFLGKTCGLMIRVKHGPQKSPQSVRAHGSRSATSSLHASQTAVSSGQGIRLVSFAVYTTISRPRCLSLNSRPNIRSTSVTGSPGYLVLDSHSMSSPRSMRVAQLSDYSVLLTSPSGFCLSPARARHTPGARDRGGDSARFGQRWAAAARSCDVHH